VISARRARPQGIRLRERLNEAHGESFELAWQTVAALPAPSAQAVQELPGIGPFYSQLIVVRACGFVDVLSADKARSRQAVHELYGITTPMTDEEYASFAERWKPYRTWAVVLVRAAAHRLG
jgi:DNA-3-methyladenine glycosylase II